MDSNLPKSETSTSAQLLTSSLREHQETLQALTGTILTDIERAGTAICEALAVGNKVLVCGNGGSAADAQHFAAELVGRYERPRRSFPAIAMTTDTSAITAISNDYGYEEVFSRQVAGLAQAGDVLVAISTSGKSPSVVRAVSKAKEIGCRIIGLSGGSGEPLAGSCDVSVVVPGQRTARIQEAHITIIHLWCEMVDSAFSKAHD